MTNNRVLKNDLKNSLHNSNNTSKIPSNGNHYSDHAALIMAIKVSSKEGILPIEFDTWSEKEQSDWLSKNYHKLYPNIPESLQSFFSALFQPLNDNRSPVELPEWFDIEKYRKGQKFVHNHYLSVMLSLVTGQFYATSFKDFLQAFIIGGNVTTPHLALKRYITTAIRLTEWYYGEPWVKGTQAYKEMRYASKMHTMTRKKMSQLTNDQIDAACTLPDPWCPNYEILLDDFAASCPFEKSGQRPYTKFSNLPFRLKGLNNADVALTQGCFMYAVLLRPHDIGIHDATDDDLDAFCHMWRCYGYFLGLEDEYNICRGNLAEIKQRLHDIFESWIKCNFKSVTPEWEHIMKCLIEPFNYIPNSYLPYKPMMLITTDTLDFKMPRFYASFNYTEWAAYKFLKFLFAYGFKLSVIRTFVNKWVRSKIEQVAYSPKQQEEITKKLKTFLPEFPLTF